LKSVASGVTFTTSATKNQEVTSGELKAKFVDGKNRLTVTSSYNSENKAKLDIGVTDAANLKGLALGSIVSFVPNTTSKDVEVSVDYGADLFHFKTLIKPFSASLDTQLTLKKDATTVGGSVKAEVSGEVKDAQVGIAYTEKDWSVGFATEALFGTFVAQFLHKPSADLTLAGLALYNKEKGKAVKIEFGGHRQLDAYSSIKIKVDNQFQLGIAYSQKLFSGLSATFGAGINAANLAHADVKLGLQLDFSA